MDSCSQSSMSSNWSKSSGSHTKGDLLQVQQMKLQTEHLLKLNTQLSANLESTNQQLRMALENAAKVDPLHNEVARLNKVLNENHHTAKKVQADLKAQIEELTNKLNEERDRHAKDADCTKKTLTKNAEEISTLHEQNKSLTAELAEAKCQLKTSNERVAKLTKQRSKLNEKAKTLSSQLDGTSARLEEATNANEEFDLNAKELNKQNDSMKRHLAAANTRLAELEQALADANSRADAAEESLDSLKIQLDSQGKELTQLNEERAQMLQLIQKLNGAAAASESRIEELENDNASLQAKVKKLSALGPQVFGDTLDCEHITVPLDGELKEKIQKIFGYDHFQPTQKVQLILNELAKEITKKSADIKEMEETQASSNQELDDLNDKCLKLSEILSSLLTEWKNLEFNANEISQAVFCTEDSRFLQLVARDGTNCKCFTECANLLGPLFVPTDIFGDEGLERRQDIINAVAAADKELAAIISAMFLINTRLKKQLSETLSSVTKKKEMEEGLAHIGCEDIVNIPTIVNDLVEKIEHLKKTRKEIHKSLRDAHDSIAQKTREEEELRDEITELHQTVATLNEKNATIETDLQIAKNELTLKNTELEKAQKIEADAQELKRKFKALQKQCTSANEENLALKSMVDEIKATAEQTQDVHVKNAIAKEQEHCDALRAKDAVIKDLEDKIEKTKKKARQMVKELKTQHDEEMTALATELESQKNVFTESLDGLQAKYHKAKVYSKNITDNLSESDKKLNAANAEKAKLQKQLKEAESKIVSLNEQIIRVGNDAKAKLSSETLAIETKHQKEASDLKNKLIKEKQDFANYVKAKLGALYGIVDFDIDDDSLEQLFNRVKSDLDKLKFFQHEATKF